MKTIIRSLITILAFAATSAFAVDPVAVWSGDFDIAEKSGLTLNLNGNARAADNSYIQITGNNGVMVSGGNVNHSTVLIKYSNLDWSNAGSGKVISLLTHKCGAKTEANCTGIAVASDGVLHGIWVNNKWSTTTGGPLVAPSDASAKVSLACTFVSAAALNAEGTRVFYKNENGTVSQVYDASGLRGTQDNTVTTDWSIGGHYGTSTGTNVKTSATGMKIYGIAIFNKWLTKDEIAAYEFPEPPASVSTKPVFLLNYKSGTGVTGWVNKAQTGGGDLQEMTDATGIYKFRTTDNYGGNFNVSFAASSSDSFQTGSYVDVFGKTHDSLMDEVKASLTLPTGTDFTADVYNTGIYQGARTWNTGRLTGLDPDTKYVIYVGMGKSASNAAGKRAAFRLGDGDCGEFDSLQYVVTQGQDNTEDATTAATSYTSFGLNQSVGPKTDSLMIVRYVGKPNSNGEFNFKLGTSTSHARDDNTTIWRSGINFLAVAEVSFGAKVTAMISENTTWSALWEGGTAPTAEDSAELTFNGSYTLTLNESATGKRFAIKGIGAANQTIKIAGSAANVAAFISKATLDSSFTGKIEYEFDCSTANFTADNALKNTIKSANANTKFVFKGAGNVGAALDYGNNVNATLNTHLVFDGGTHTFKYGQGSQSTDFGRGATSTDPTLYVKSGTTLNVHGKDMSGWTGSYNANAIIRVDDGGVANLCYNDGTFFYRHQLYLMPGAKVDIQTDQFFLQGGKAGNQIYVPESNSTKPAVITGTIALHPDQNREFGIYVGKGSTLKIAKVGTNTNASNKNVVKYGEGTLIATDTVNLNTFEISLGAFGVEGAVSLSALTLNSSAMLDINSGAPIVTGSLSTPVSKQLNLAIAAPTHMMEVITLPTAADKTGWTAIVNGREAENELIVEGNTLKLKWKIPPTIDVDIDDITIEPTSDWNGGTVKIGVSSLVENDYTGEITYRLKFGDKTVEGSVENNVATFTLDDYFTAGNIYRGIFELGYGDAGDTIEAAEVIVYEGKLAYKNKDDLWVNETPTTLKSTGSYDPDNVTVVDDIIEINTQDKVTFSPTLDPDYVDKCDSELTMTIFASEAVDDDMLVEEGAQAGVMIISDGSDGVEFRFIGCDENGEWQWMQGPAAELNTDYEVTISFHYAKDADDSDSVTYTIKGFTGGSYTYAHRPNTADKVTEIVFADGTRFKSLIGTCQIEIADPVAQGIKPGETQEITADNDDEAQEKAAKIPVMIPEDDADVIAALDTDAKKDKYKTHFKVVAVKKNGAYIAEVVFAEEAKKDIKDDEEKILTEVVSALSSLLGEEGELENITGQPGLYYGIASDGELVKMGNAQPDDWKIAGADGNIVGLKVKKTASAKQGFYKVICTPTKPTK